MSTQWRPYLGQFDLPPQQLSRTETTAELTRVLRDSVAVYSSAPFSHAALARLDNEISRCELLISKVLIDIDAPSAESEARSCLTNLRALLKQEADAAFVEGSATTDKEFSTRMAIIGGLSILSAGVSAYHGYKRNNSAGWGVWWGLMGALFPVVTPVVAISQGYSKRA